MFRRLGRRSEWGVKEWVWEVGILPAGRGRFGMREQREVWILGFGSISRGEMKFLGRYRAVFGMSLSTYRFLL